MTLSPAWATWWIQDLPELHGETIFKKWNKNYYKSYMKNTTYIAIFSLHMLCKCKLPVHPFSEIINDDWRLVEHNMHSVNLRVKRKGERSQLEQCASTGRGTRVHRPKGSQLPSASKFSMQINIVLTCHPNKFNCNTVHKFKIFHLCLE